MTKPTIQINHLSYCYPQTPLAINEWSYTFHRLKYGIIGDNGTGKSTLLHLINGLINPDLGSIDIDAKLHFMRQDSQAIAEDITVKQLLGVQELLAAFNRIEQGSCQVQDYELIGDNWDIENQINTCLQSVNLSLSTLDMPFNALSGGQKTKVLLASAMLFQPDFILMDEPSNNLDKHARESLHQFIEQSKQGLLIVSHDRDLLNHVDIIIELTHRGINHYGGNFDFYRQQKELERLAAAASVKSNQEILAKAQKTVQTRFERHEQNQAKGIKAKKKEIIAKGCYDKIAFKSKQGRSEKTNKRIRTQADNKLKVLDDKLSDSKLLIEHKNKIKASMDKTKVANNKIIIEIKDLHFQYSVTDKPLFSHYDLLLKGAERVVITGENGSGKSTLLKLMTKEITANKGEVHCHEPDFAYFDQEVSLLNPAMSLIDNYKQLNPTATTNEAYQALASFNFRNTCAEKLAGDLSGGERMRAGLAIRLMSPKPPKLLLLDEPTNHLDINSIQAIETIIRQYQGTIIVISHDQQFLNHCNIKKQITLK